MFLDASINLVAVVLGVDALIIVLSIMDGFRAELFDEIAGLNGHAVVEGHHGRAWRLATDRTTEAQATSGGISARPLIQEPLIGTANNVVK